MQRTMNQGMNQGMNINNGDSIDSLPVDQTILSHNEEQIANMIFKQQKSNFDKLLSGSKDVFMLGILFMIFSLKQVDGVIHKFIPCTRNSEYIFLLVKTILFTVIFFLIKNLYLARV